MLNVNLPLESLTGGFNSVPLVAIYPWKEYDESGKSGKSLGFTLEILLLSNNCEKVRVHIQGSTQIVEPEEIEEHNKNANFLMVKFEGFQAKPYSSNGHIQISAKADKAVLVNNNLGTGATKA